MTVSSEANRAGPYNGNGVTTSFAYGFKVRSDEHLRVVKTVGGVDTDAVLNSEYTVTGVGNDAGGSVVFSVAPSVGTQITALLNIPFTQLVDLENQGAYYAEVVEAALDQAASRDLQLSERLNRAVVLPASTSSGELTDFINAIYGASAAGTAASASASAAAASAGSAATSAAASASSAASAASAASSAVASVYTGQCRLDLTGGNLVLSRRNGRLLTINGVHQAIPAAGVSLAATGTTAGTLYYIYAYMSGSTMSLEASTTIPEMDLALGYPVKTGDATRTLVGMARPVSGPAWADSTTQRLVVSWYNRTTKAAANFFTADRTTASASYVELNSEIRVEFLSWGDEALTFSSSGGMSQNGTSAVGVRIAIDGTANWLAQSIGGGGNGIIAPVNASAGFTPTQGYHYLTLLGFASGGSTGTFYGTNALLRCFVHAQIRG